MPDDLARHHQLHGVQPVLPVADVQAAAEWFRDVLGLQIEFVHGEPPQHARVMAGRLGPGGWGAPVYIHLSLAASLPVAPCGELRIHVGHALDELFARCRRHGAQLLTPPANQPWGLREFVLATPDGHRLRLCAEV